MSESLADALWAAINGKGIRGRLFREDCEYLAAIAAAWYEVRR